MPPALAALIARALPAGLAGIRKALVVAVGTATVTAVAALGPTWGAVIAALVTVAATYWTPNDTDGDGKITVVDYAQAVAGLVIDRAAADLADRVNSAAPTEAIALAPAAPSPLPPVTAVVGGVAERVPEDVPGLGPVQPHGNHPA